MFKSKYKLVRFLASIFGILILFFLLEKSLLILFKDSWFEILFKNIQSSFRNDILISILFLGISFYYLSKIIRGFRFSQLHYFIICSISIIYITYRIQKSTPITFTEYSICPIIKYLDWLFLILAFNLYAYFKQLIATPKKITNKSILYIDEPINELIEDQLQRQSLAQGIIRQVTDLNIIKSYAIGITGKWGDGKTSLLNMIRSEITKLPECLIIEFNPWLSSNVNNIIEDYFLLLQNEISNFTSELGYTIDDYASKLKISDSKQIIDSIREITNKKSSSDQKYRIIRDILNLINKKIVVLIDDIDRLEKKEVVEVIKLIRNSGSFYNTIFIVTYDREYINKAIQDITDQNIDEYLDKIFQIEINVPPIRNEFISEYIRKKLISHFPKHENEIQEAISLLQNIQSGNLLSFLMIDKKIPSYTNYLGVYIRNYRDAVRFINSISIFYNNIQGEISLSELMILHLIKLKFKVVYENLINKSIISHKNVNGKDLLTFDKTLYDSIPNITSDRDKQNVSELLDMLFSDSKTFPRSIIFPNSFDLYFDNQIYGTISILELNALMNGNFEKFSDKVIEWISNGHSSELVRFLRSINNFNDAHEYENYIKILFQIMNTGSGIVYDRLIEILQKDYNKKLTDAFYDTSNLKALNELVIGLIIKSEDTGNVNEFLHKVHQNFNYRPDYQFIILYDEYKSSCLIRLNNYLSSILYIQEESFQYLYRCIDSINKADSRVTLMAEAIKKFREKLNNNPNEYLRHIIVEPFRPHDSHTYSFEAFTQQIFGDYDAFTKFLDEPSINPEIGGLIKQVFELYKNNNYQMVYIHDEVLIQKINDLRIKGLSGLNKTKC